MFGVLGTIIVGLDSGSVTAVAVMDLDGHLLALKSRKHWPHADLYSFLAQFAPLTIVASDRNPASHAAVRMAASFSARLFKPTHHLGVFDKTRAARFSGAKNAHERDAFAAAKKAFDVVCSNKVRNLDRRFGPAATLRVKAAVLSGMRWDDALASASRF